MLMRIKGIKEVNLRRRGVAYRYFYHRATGSRIEAEFGTPAFALEVERLNQRAIETAPRDGSLNALITAYRSKPEFTGLAQRTQSDYQKVFDWLQPIVDMPLLEISTAEIYDLRDKAFEQKKRRFANYVVQVMRLLLEWGRSRGHVTENVAVGVATIPRPKNMPRANRPWTDAEREVVLAHAPIMLRAVIALGMFAALREGDACALPKSAYDGKLIESVASKNGEPLWIPAHYRLREILREAAAARQEALAARAKRRTVLPFDPPSLVVTSRGRQWTTSGFRASFFKLIAVLEAEGLVGPGLTFHGLRHTVGKLVMEAGGSKEDVGMLLSDRSPSMAEHYSREHEKKGRVTATMLKLERTERARIAREKNK